MTTHDKDRVGNTTNMTDKIRESLSALYDGQADAFEARRALDEAARNPQLDRDWQNYSLIGDALRSQGAGAPDFDLSASVMQAINGQDEQITTTESKPHWTRKWYSQAAIAAGVAFTLMVGFNATQTQTQVEFAQSDIQLNNSTQANPLALQASTLQPRAPMTPGAQALQAQLQSDIQAYMIRHAEHAAASGQQGLLPLARVMDHDQEKP